MPDAVQTLTRGPGESRGGRVVIPPAPADDPPVVRPDGCPPDLGECHDRREVPQPLAQGRTARIDPRDRHARWWAKRVPPRRPAPLGPRDRLDGARPHPAS